MKYSKLLILSTRCFTLILGMKPEIKIFLSFPRRRCVFIYSLILTILPNRIFFFEITLFFDYVSDKNFFNNRNDALWKRLSLFCFLMKMLSSEKTASPSKFFPIKLSGLRRGFLNSFPSLSRVPRI